MRDHKTNEFNDLMDGHIRRCLKNWASQQQPPESGRARLLLVAASPASKWERISSRKESGTDYIPNDSHRPPSFWASEANKQSQVMFIDLTLIPLRHGS
jgi:hypothetical protein